MPRPISTLFPYTTLFRSIRMSRNFGMKMLTMTNLSTECLIQLTKLGYALRGQIRSEERFSRNAETDIDTLSLHDALPFYQNEPQLRDENAHNDKSVHGVLNPTYQAGLRTPRTD